MSWYGQIDGNIESIRVGSDTAINFLFRAPDIFLRNTALPFRVEHRSPLRADQPYFEFFGRFIAHPDAGMNGTAQPITQVKRDGFQIENTDSEFPPANPGKYSPDHQGESGKRKNKQKPGEVRLAPFTYYSESGDTAGNYIPYYRKTDQQADTARSVRGVFCR